MYILWPEFFLFHIHVCVHVLDYDYELLTNVGSTQSSSQRPGSEVCDLVVDGQTLNTSDKATIRPCGPNQPINIRRSTHIQRGTECDLCVLALKGRQWDLWSSMAEKTLVHALNSLKGDIVRNSLFWNRITCVILLPASVQIQECHCLFAANHSFHLWIRWLCATDQQQYDSRWQSELLLCHS